MYTSFINNLPLDIISHITPLEYINLDTMIKVLRDIQHIDDNVIYPKIITDILPQDIINIISGMAGINQQLLTKIINDKIDYETDTIFISSHGTIYSGYGTSSNDTHECVCEHIKAIDGGKGVECPHFRFYEPPKGRTIYNGNMKLSQDTDLIFDDDICLVCKTTACNVLNLRCGCTYHKHCMGKELKFMNDECPCVREICLKCFDCSFYVIL